MKPTNSLAKDLTLEKGLMRARAPGFIFCISSKAIPVPIDLPIRIICFY